MYKVVFRNSAGQEREIGTGENKQDVLAIINQFLRDHNFKSYYKRTWKEGPDTWIDVGSHTEFFIVREE